MIWNWNTTPLTEKEKGLLNETKWQGLDIVDIVSNKSRASNTVEQDDECNPFNYGVERTTSDKAGVGMLLQNSCLAVLQVSVGRPLNVFATGIRPKPNCTVIWDSRKTNDALRMIEAYKTLISLGNFNVFIGNDIGLWKSVIVENGFALETLT